MRFTFSFLLLTYLLLFSCQKTEKADKEVFQSIQQTGQLVTVEYSLSKMVKAADSRTWYKVGDRRILISIEAVIKAGVDLQHINKEDVSVTGDAIRLQVPAAKILSVAMPPEKIKVLYQDVSFFRREFSAAERENLLRQAEKQVRELAHSMGIIATAQKNAETFLRNLLKQGGYKTITIAFTK